MDIVFQATFLIGGIGCIVAGFASTYFFWKAHYEVKPAPLLVKIFGFQIYMKKYLTEKGVYLRNKAFRFMFFSIFCIFIVFSAIAINKPEDFKKMITIPKTVPNQSFNFDLGDAAHPSAS